MPVLVCARASCAKTQDVATHEAHREYRCEHCGGSLELLADPVSTRITLVVAGSLAGATAAQADVLWSNGGSA